MGPQYQKLKKVPAVKDEAEAAALIAQILPRCVLPRPCLLLPASLLTHLSFSEPSSFASTAP